MVLTRLSRMILGLLAAALFLTGCAVHSAQPTRRQNITGEEHIVTKTTPPSETAVPQMSEASQSPLEETQLTSPETQSTPEDWSGRWKMSIPQLGDPITPQPGDTSATWNEERAAMFPGDDVCDDAMLLEKYLTTEGLSWTDLSSRGCRQLILVVGRGDSDAVITCYRREAQGWVSEPGLTRITGWTGKKGIAHNRQRNTLTTPAGLWALGEAFGNAPRPAGLGLPWRDVTEHSDWVCDDQSPYFNTWQERGDPELQSSWNWEDTEHLEDYPASYAYACVICYNTPPYTIPDRGCAIFFHCAKGPTEGCVGLPEEQFLKTLLWLDPEASPYILIATGE